MRRLHLTSSLLCAASLLALSPTVDPLAFHPEDGSEAGKQFSLEGDFELDDFSAVMDGQDMSGAIPMGEVAGDFELLIDLVDRYVKTIDGMPRELQREYVTSSADWTMMGESGTNENLSDLDGETIVFKWNEEAKKYDVTYADGEGDPERIQHERVDLDYRTLLPGKQVAAADRWTVERDGIVTALFFGLEVSQILEQMEDEDAPPELEEMKQTVLPELGKLFDGFKGECEYVGTRDEGGVEVGVIKLVVRSEGTADLVSAITSVVEEQAGSQGLEFDIGTAALTLQIEGEGELLWNLKAGHAHSFAFEADAELGFEIDAKVTDPGGTEHTGDVSATFASHLKWSMAKSKGE